MPIKLGDLTRQTKAVTVRFDDTDDTLTVAYRPRNLTPALLAELERAERQRDVAELTVGAVVGLVAGWDLLGDDGEPVPLTDDALAGVPLEVLGAVVRAVMEDATAGPLSSNGSAAISSLAAN